MVFLIDFFIGFNNLNRNANLLKINHIEKEMNKLQENFMMLLKTYKQARQEGSSSLF